MYWKITVTTPYCGTDNTHYFEGGTLKEMEEIGDQLAYENGEEYSYCHTGWDEDFKDEEDEKSYYDDCTYSIEEITEEEYEENK